MADAGRVAAITGAFGSLGAAVARLARERGWRLALIDAAPASAAPADLAAGALVLGGVDLTDAAGAAAAIGAVSERLGRLDALFNIAGTFRWTTLEGSDAALWELLFRVNLQTAANASRAALPALKASGAGRIVNVGADAATRAAAGMGPYAASKAGVARLTESLAEELKDAGVTVNAVAPTILDTPPNRADMPDADFARWVQPADVAEVMLFLASDAARAVTGALVRVANRT
ncbi:MAG TPA: SDR family NAD(P)-dependent oxidoreductase [Caulobacteraceae bacterium]|jgi:NAD(P)-dependent dehydrogenase (short-subunit alcohol dehydrogenase family)